MSNPERADPFADTLDLSDFNKRPVKKQPVDLDAIKDLSIANRFPSRSSETASGPDDPATIRRRRKRTGRDAQIGLRVTIEVKEQFYRLADDFFVKTQLPAGEFFSQMLDLYEAHVNKN